MITNQLLRPASIVVVGASNNVHKPGGAILRNLINGGYTGELRAVNPKGTEVQGVTAYADVKDIPDTDLAILAIPASFLSGCGRIACCGKAGTCVHHSLCRFRRGNA